MDTHQERTTVLLDGTSRQVGRVKQVSYNNYEGEGYDRLQNCLTGSSEGRRPDTSREARSHGSNLSFLPPLLSRREKCYAEGKTEKGDRANVKGIVICGAKQREKLGKV